jgi:hypothetical protein
LPSVRINAHSLRRARLSMMNEYVQPVVSVAANEIGIDLTVSVYIEPRLLDVAEALSVLPELSLAGAALAATRVTAASA